MKLNKDDAREKFRQTCSITSINELEERDPDYRYRLTEATTPAEGMRRIDRYIDRGWEVIYSKDKLKDDRSARASVDNNKEEGCREAPVTTTSRSGRTFILMRIHKDKDRENQLNDKQKREARLREQQKITNQGQNQFIHAPDIKLT